MKSQARSERENHRVFWIDLQGQVQRPVFAKPRKATHDLFSWCKCGAWTETNEIPGVATCHRCRRKNEKGKIYARAARV